MNRIAFIGALGVLTACGAPQSEVAPSSVDEAVVVEAQPEPDPLPGCPVDLERIRSAAVGFNVAIQDEPESWLRLRVAAGSNESELSFDYEVRDESGHDVGSEHFVCTSQGLVLREARSGDHTIEFVPPLMVVPMGIDSGQSAGTARLTTPEGLVEVGYTHRFEMSASPPTEFEGETIQVVSTLQLDGELTTQVESATVWVIAPDFIAPVTRAQSRDGAGVRVESVRTLTR